MDSKELKMQLLEKFGVAQNKQAVDFCREAYKFLTEDGTDARDVTPLAIEASDEPVAVDLGLPSGTLWCDRNVGAKSPTDYGAFFSWGNTEPHFPNKCDNEWGDEKVAFAYDFDEDTYEETDGAKLRGDIDLAYDAAHVNMGEPWRMPSIEQYKELFDNCVLSRETINGVNGYNAISKINGNSIFFPCSGNGNGRSWNNRGGDGYYWSRSFSSARYARVLFFYGGGVSPQGTSDRYGGFAVRAISPKKRIMTKSFKTI